MPENRLTPTGLPYRPCVGIVLLNRQGLVWIGKRAPSKTVDSYDKPWQLPQGGIDRGEAPREAAFRELHEETGIRHAEVIHETPNWLYYDLPPEVLGRTKSNRWGGQKQKYFGMRFDGRDDDFDLEVHHPEFIEWRWAEIAELPAIAVPFKLHIYEQVANEFAPVAAKMRVL